MPFGGSRPLEPTDRMSVAEHAVAPKPSPLGLFVAPSAQQLKDPGDLLQVFLRKAAYETFVASVATVATWGFVESFS